jgi:aminoglycoside N3'-acetyltransferase
MQNSVSRLALGEGLRRLGLAGKPVAVHSSLRSLGNVEGGAETIISALQEVCSTVLMPGFQCAAKILPPPEKRYRQNGCDYAVHFDSVSPPRPFDVETAPLHPKMGVVCQTFSKMAGVLRSYHPWHSWLGRGERAPALLADHPWETTNRPLETLAAVGGFFLLLGVDLSSCTAVHVAEERAGRRPFIRWAMDSQRVIREVATSGCAKGFEALAPHCRHVFRIERIGDCLAQAAPIRELMRCLVPVIRAQPELTRCSLDCLRCRDAILCGPLPANGASVWNSVHDS